MAFGGNATWFYGDLTAATSSTLGVGCPGTAGVPTLSCGVPRLGNPAFALDLASARPSMPCWFALAATAANRPVGPCTLYLGDPFVTIAAGTNAFGFASTQLALPFLAPLRGQSVFAQAAVADPLGIPGIAFTPGLQIVLGY